MCYEEKDRRRVEKGVGETNGLSSPTRELVPLKNEVVALYDGLVGASVKESLAILLSTELIRRRMQFRMEPVEGERIMVMVKSRFRADLEHLVR
jgi:hypothetical protein